MSPEAARALRERNEATASCREGSIWFFHCLSTLNDESGLYSLFRYWGGEAVYCLHETDSPACAELPSIGTPCIVLAALHPSEVGFFSTFEERMIRVWLDRDDPDAHSQDCDTRVTHPRVRVLDVIVRADVLFDELTGCLGWNRSIDSS